MSQDTRILEAMLSYAERKRPQDIPEIKAPNRGLAVESGTEYHRD